jgi:O-antigen/teichoic acid export membrane protein
VRRLADIGLFYIAQQVLNLRALLLIPLIARTLGVGGYGTVVLGWNGATLVQLLTSLALPYGIVRLLSARPEPAVARTTLPTLGLFILAPWALLATLLLGLADPLGAQLGVPEPRLFAALVAVRGLLEAWYFVFTSYWTAGGHNQRYATAQAGLYAGDLLAVVGALLSGQGVIGVLAASTVWEGVYVAALVGWILRETGIGPLDGRELRRYLAFCLPAVVLLVTFWLLSLSDRYILAIYWDTERVGVYNAAYSLANLITAYNTAIWWLYGPRASRRFDNEGPAAGCVELRAAVRWFLALALPMAVGLAVLTEPLLELLLGRGSTWEAAVVAPLVSLAAIAYALYVGVTWTFSLRLDTRPLAVLSLAAGALNIGANLLLVPSLGIVGAALSSAGSHLVLFGLAYTYGRRELALPIPWAFALRSAAAATIMGALVVALDPPVHLVWLSAAAGLGAAVYFALLLLLGGITADERLRIYGGLQVIARRLRGGSGSRR